MGSGPSGICHAESPRLNAAALGEVELLQLPACSHASPNVSESPVFFQKHMKIIEALTALTKVQP